jgi:hypothetical protein
LFTPEKGVDVAICDRRGVDFDRELAGDLLEVQEQLQAFADDLVFLDSQQAVAGEAKIARPGFAEVATAGAQDKFLGAISQVAGFDATAQVVDGDLVAMRPDFFVGGDVDQEEVVLEWWLFEQAAGITLHAPKGVDDDACQAHQQSA